MLTLGQAAKEAAVSKATISRAIASGLLSATRNDKGGFDIDPAELFRVYPRNSTTVAGNGAMKRDATGAVKADETPLLRAENESLRRERDILRELADYLKAQRDGWQRQAEQLVLTDRRQRPAAWLSRLFTKTA